LVWGVGFGGGGFGLLFSTISPSSMLLRWEDFFFFTFPRISFLLWVWPLFGISFTLMSAPFFCVLRRLAHDDSLPFFLRFWSSRSVSLSFLCLRISLSSGRWKPGFYLCFFYPWSFPLNVARPPSPGSCCFLRTEFAPADRRLVLFFLGDCHSSLFRFVLYVPRAQPLSDSLVPSPSSGNFDGWAGLFPSSGFSLVDPFFVAFVSLEVPLFLCLNCCRFFPVKFFFFQLAMSRTLVEFAFGSPCVT